MVIVSNLYDAAQERLYPHRETLQLFGLGLLFTLPGLYLLFHGQYSLLTFLVVAAAFLISWTIDKRLSIAFVFIYQFLLGDIRRIVNMYAGYPKLDPLLLAGPIFTVAIAFPILLKVKVSDLLSKALLGLTAVMILEIINPRQGSIVVGFSGAMFLLVPLFWFWMGRAFATESLIEMLVYRVVLPLSLLAAFLGLSQTFVGFLPWEQAWIKHALENGYVALGLGNGHIRSFGFSVNSIEYGTLLMFGSVACVAAIFAGQRVYAIVLPILLTALLLASMRGLILKVAVCLVIMWAVRGKNRKSWIKRLFFGGLFALAVLVYSIRHAASSSSEAQVEKTAKSSSAGAATTHVTQGLAHPLDPKYSSAGLHASMFFGGITTGLKNPFGLGLGMVTLGANKFGAASGGGSSEIDISDAFISMGLIGGPLYLFIVGLGFVEAAKYVLVGPRRLSYFILGLFIGMLGEWMPLGQYAAGPFVWFYVGFLANQELLARKLASGEEEAYTFPAQEIADEAGPVTPSIA